LFFVGVAHGYGVVGGCFFTMWFMSSFGGLFVSFLWALNIFRYVSSLSFDIPLCFDSHGLSSDALFSQLLMRWFQNI